MDEHFDQRILGKTGLSVGPMGVSGGYGAPAKAFELAFERGCNYFYHGSRRMPGMNKAIKNLVAQGKRNELVIVDQIYTRFGWHLRHSFDSFRKKTGLDHADVLLLGWYNSDPPLRILDTCEKMKQDGLFKHLAISGHKRISFPEFAKQGRYDIFHVRYNAAHRGAETEVFPNLPEDDKPGIVIYTATRWGNLLDPKRMPKGQTPPSAADCYRFVMTNPNVGVCMTGPKNLMQMEQALEALDQGPMNDEELARMRTIGDHVHKQNAFYKI